MLEDRWTQLVMALLGDPDARTKREWRYGSRGSLVVNFGGPRAGKWKSFESGDGGGPIQLIQYIKGLEWRDAYAWARRWLGIEDDRVPFVAPLMKPTKTEGQIKAEQEAEEAATANAMARLVRYISEAVPATGTLAGAYLRKRGITGPLPATCQFHPRGYHSKEHGLLPALVLPAVDANGVVQTCQSIFLDRATAGKAEVSPPKKSFGGCPIKGATVRFPGKAPLHVAEGPETALSIWLATGCETWACLGVGNIVNAPVPEESTVVICRDDDKPGSQADKAIGKAVKAFTERGCTVLVAAPTHGLSDFNDVLQQHGIDAVREALAAARMVRQKTRQPPVGKGINLQPYYAPITATREQGLKALDDAFGSFFDATARRLVADSAAAKLIAKRMEKAEPSIRAEIEAAGEIVGGSPVMVLGVEVEHVVSDAEKRIRNRWRQRITKDVKARVSARMKVELTRQRQKSSDAPPAKPITGADKRKRMLPPPKRLQITSPAGSGKTSSIAKYLLRYPSLARRFTIWITEPTTAKAEEIHTDLSTAGVENTLILGRSGTNWRMADSDGNAPRMCARYELAEAVAEKGLNVSRTMCRWCPVKEQCEATGYMSQRTDKPGVYVLSSAYLTTPACPAPEPDLVIADESIVQQLAVRLCFGPERITGDGIPFQDCGYSMGERIDFSSTIARIRNAVTGRVPVMEGVRATIKLAELEALAEALADVDDAMSGGDEGLDDEAVHAMLNRYERVPIKPLIQLVDALKRKYSAKHSTANDIRYDPAYPVTVDKKRSTTPRVILNHRKKVSIPETTTVLALDASADLTINRMIWGDDLEDAGIAIERNAIVTQVWSRTFSRSSVLGYDDESETQRGNVEELRSEIEAVVDRVQRDHGETLVVSYKKAGFEHANFGAVRGLNTYSGCAAAVIVGREEPMRQAEDLARAYYADDAEPIVTIDNDAWVAGFYRATVRYRMRNGEVGVCDVARHPDDRVQRFLEQSREREIEQAIDRLRLIHNVEPKHVYILTSVPVNVTVDRIVRWPDLVDGGTKYERAWEQRGILPTGAAHLHRLFPNLWQSKEAAEHDLKRKPIRGAKFYIESSYKLAPLSVQYRLKGQPGSAANAFVDGGRYSDVQAALEAAFRCAVNVIPNPTPETEISTDTSSNVVRLANIKPFLDRVKSGAIPPKLAQTDEHGNDVIVLPWLQGLVRFLPEGGYVLDFNNAPAQVAA